MLFKQSCDVVFTSNMWDLSGTLLSIFFETITNLIVVVFSNISALSIQSSFYAYHYFFLQFLFEFES